MAIRKPDGVQTPDSFVEEPDRGPVLGQAQTDARAMAGALKPGEAFPSGLKALDVLEAAEKKEATICNLSLKTFRFDRVSGPQPDGKKQVTQVTLQPFKTITLPLDEARRVMKQQEQAPPGRRPKPMVVVVGAFPGNCEGKRKFKLTIDAKGRTRPYGTCPYHGCPHHDHGERPFSVWQAQHFMRELGTPEAIERFAEQFDLRLDVTALAMFERGKREELNRLQRMEAAKTAGSLTAVN